MPCRSLDCASIVQETGFKINSMFLSCLTAFRKARVAREKVGKTGIDLLLRDSSVKPKRNSEFVDSRTRLAYIERNTMDPREFRQIGHRVVDLLAEYFTNIEDKPLFPVVQPRHLTEAFAEPLPQEATSADEVIQALEEKLLPYSTHVGHPGYFGLITPSPTPVGALADFIASALNQNVGAYTIGPAAVAMERCTVRWLIDLVG